MRVVLTGATGFIGRHLAHALRKAADAELFCVARESCAVGTAVRADLSQRGWTSALPPRADVVFHMAQSGRYRDFPEAAADIVAVNVDATAELASWARVAGVRVLLFASSGNVYGHTSMPASESAPTDPRTMYAASKLSAELLLRPYSSWFQVVIARLFGVYGPGQKAALVPTIIKRILDGDEITLAKGIGVRLNPVYVDDCVGILTRLSTARHAADYEIYNVGGQETVDLPTLVAMVEEITFRSARVRLTDDAPTLLNGNINKVLLVLNDMHWTSLREGLEKTIGSRLS